MSAPQVLDAERELLLSHFTIENLHEAVYWVDSAQNIIQVNDLACQISGYTKEELTKKKDAVPPPKTMASAQNTKNNGNMLAQVVGIIIGSPEYQRR